MFKKTIVLRDSMLVGTMLSCSEAWYNLTEEDLGQVEQADKGLWCSLMEVARTTPSDRLCLELGIEPLLFIIMRRTLTLNEKSRKGHFNACCTRRLKGIEREWKLTMTG